MKNIIFDMYGVIIKESKGNFIPYTYKYFPKTNKSFLVSQFNNAGLGVINSKEFLTSLGFKDYKFNQKDYIENYLTFDKEFIAFAENYKDIYKFSLLSNDVLEWNEYILD